MKSYLDIRSLNSISLKTDYNFGILHDEYRWVLRNSFFDSQKFIDELKKDSEVARLYEMWAGGGEGYSVEQHTSRVLDVFATEFAPNDGVAILLQRVGLTYTEFALFLALHDIGKGLSVADGYMACRGTGNKTVEYIKTAPIVLEQMQAIGISPEKVRLFLALLHTDAIGEVFKAQGSAASIEKAVRDIREGDYHGLPVEDFLHLLTLFHAIDASSYPYIRKFFACSSEQSPIEGLTHLQGHSNAQKEALAELAKALNCQAPNLSTWLKSTDSSKNTLDLNRNDFKTLNTAQVYEAVKDHRCWKKSLEKQGIDLNTHADYQRRRLLVKDLKNCKPVLRFVSFLKAREIAGRFLFNGYRNWDLLERIAVQAENLSSPNRDEVRKAIEKTEGNVFSNRLTKEQRNRVLSNFISQKMSTEVNEALAKIGEFIAYHGTNSATLAMMFIRQDFSLYSTRELREQRLAPPSGEGEGGISRHGNNAIGVSFVTPDALSRGWEYANSISFSSMPSDEKIKSFFSHSHFPENTYYGLDWKPALECLYKHSPKLFAQFIKEHNKLILADLKRELGTLPREIPELAEGIAAFEQLITIVSSNNPADSFKFSSIEIENLSPAQKKIFERMLNPGKHLLDEQTGLELFLDKLLKAQQHNADALYEAFENIAPSSHWISYIEELESEIETLYTSFSQLRLHRLADSEQQFLTTTLPKTSNDIKKEEMLTIGPLSPANVYKALTCKGELNSIRHEMAQTSGLRTERWPSIYYLTLTYLLAHNQEGLNTLNEVMLQEFIAVKNACYSLKQIFLKKKPLITLSEHSEITQMLTHPFPVLMALSASSGPKPYKLVKEWEVLLKGISFGKEGIHHLFTDTQEHMEQIRAILPANLQEEITIGLFSDLKRDHEIASKQIPLVIPSWMSNSEFKMLEIHAEKRIWESN